MISVSKLLCDVGAAGDGLRYDAADETDRPQITERKQRRPVVVWNCTKQCNLACAHCYAAATRTPAPGELSTREGERLLDDLAAFGVPVVLFSGGEPMARDDLVHLVEYAADAGLRPVLSTNGTLLTPERARELRDAGLQYVGVSIDGLPERHDAFRGEEGAFDAALRGIRVGLDAGLKTGLRYTITRRNAADLPDVIDLLVDEGVDRFCVYHLAYGGRGADVAADDLSPAERRAAVRDLCDSTLEYHDRGQEIETLLVGNYADAAYLVEYARRELGAAAAARVRDYLERNGGDPTGERVADVDYQGNVHPTQFWQSYSLGNVRDRAFGDVWTDETNPLLRRLRERPAHLTGRCADCAYRDVCRGASRLRALAVSDDPFAPDPQCYLHDEEIASDAATDAATDAASDATTDAPTGD